MATIAEAYKELFAKVAFAHLIDRLIRHGNAQSSATGYSTAQTAPPRLENLLSAAKAATL